MRYTASVDEGILDSFYKRDSLPSRGSPDKLRGPFDF